MINCHEGSVKRILAEAYEKLNFKEDHGIKDWKIEEQSQMLEMADIIFSHSPCVTQSLLESGVSAAKILQTSYGIKSEYRLDHYQKPKK